MKRLYVVVVTLAIAIALVVPAVANTPIQPARPVPTPDGSDVWVNESPTAWFVELDSPPAADGTVRSRLAAERQSFRQQARDQGIEVTVRFTYETLFNGVSVETDAGAAARISELPGVRAVYPVDTIPLPATDTSGPAMATAIQMTGADIVQSELGFTGSGIRVAVMDTGIDYHHPDLGGCFGRGCRVAFGWDFVGDDFNADPFDPGYNPVPAPDPDPDDCEGHGTHVAGIVGANGDIVGVAPDVTFGAYRVFGCEGSTTADIMLAAMERALADGMDVLNMSIGSSYQWPQYPTAQAADRLVNQGMVVVASIGNSGATGTFSAGAPGLGKDVIGVAAFENTTATFPVAVAQGRASQPPHDIGHNAMSFAAPAPTSGSTEIVYIGPACDGDDLLANPNGRVALAERGECPFREKAENAINAGATAVVIHNNAPGNYGGTLGAPQEDWVVVSISQEHGMLIRETQGRVRWTWTDRVEAFPNPLGGLISDFSSYGLAPDLTLKPDIGAPGGNIYSTYPLEKGGFANLGGTSMSSPHVAGAVALLLEARPNTAPSLVRDILQNSADPHAWSLDPDLPAFEPVHRQGAGMLDIDDAILQATIVSPGKLSLGESEAGAPVEMRFRVQNTSSQVVTYTLDREVDGLVGCCSAGLGTTGVFAEEGFGFYLTAETVAFDRDVFRLAPGATRTVRVTITPETPQGDFDRVQYGGWLRITPDDGSDPLRVPYAGFIGDYQGYQVLTPGAAGLFPALGVTENGINFGLVPPGWSYSMEGFDVPNILVHLHHQSQRMSVELYNADGTPVHPARFEVLRFDYLPRNGTTTGFFAFPWDGYFMRPTGQPSEREVPNGEYYFIVRVLKALGDEGTRSHWEVWQSSTFFVDRP